MSNRSVSTERICASTIGPTFAHGLSMIMSSIDDGAQMTPGDGTLGHTSVDVE